MSIKNLQIPQNYDNKLDIIHTQYAIDLIIKTFSNRLSKGMQFSKIIAPLHINSPIGWIRTAIKNYNYPDGEGVFADFYQLEQNQNLDNLHSDCIHKWGFAKIITEKENSTQFLKDFAQELVSEIKMTQDAFCTIFYNMDSFINEDVFFITQQELEQAFPNLNQKQREDEICKKHSTVFIINNQGKLSLCGKLLIQYPVLNQSVTVFCLDIMKQNEQITICGEIEKSRLCMLMLQKAHIGEVLPSVWDYETVEICNENNIILL
jgi:aspartate--ammonia ligase